MSIDPLSPAFEDYPYDPYPGSPGDLFEPLPDVFDPADWSQPTQPADHATDRARILHALRDAGGHATFEQLYTCVGADEATFGAMIGDLVGDGAVAFYLGQPLPDSRVEHLYVLTDTGRALLPAPQSSGDRLATFVEFLASLQRADRTQEPPDGTIILVDEDAAYVRTDPPPGEPLRRLASGMEVGDWHPLGGDGTAEPISLLEILGHDDPPCDRTPHSFERLYTAGDIAWLAAWFTADGNG